MNNFVDLMIAMLNEESNFEVCNEPPSDKISTAVRR